MNLLVVNKEGINLNDGSLPFLTLLELTIWSVFQLHIRTIELHSSVSITITPVQGSTLTKLGDRTEKEKGSDLGLLRIFQVKLFVKSSDEQFVCNQIRIPMPLTDR